MSSNYELLSDFTFGPGIKVQKFISKTTNLQIVLANVEGPLVNGFFTLATESHCDDGCPHTLEHLVFLGSEQYPFKGVLDEVANRNLAQGTNAWTATDHTSYTIETAGAEGFLNLLPVYLDHILYPTLTDSGFVTEVHHITGEGQNAGVVYCEMQARENTGHSRVHRSMLHALYPGVTGYKSETGGIMADIRALSNQAIRDFHKAYYRPDNLSLIITGKVEPEQLFPVLSKYEQERIASKGALPSMTRPWQSPVPPLTAPVRQTVQYPSDDETVGMVTIAWRGPEWSDFVTRLAIDELWSYLSKTALSPLHKAFIETENPLCGDVDCYTLEYLQTSHCVHFEDVPKERVSEVEEAFFTVVKQVMSESLDMDRLQTIIHRSKRKFLESLEANPGRVIATVAVEDFLYGDRKAGTPSQQLKTFLDRGAILDQLATKDEAYWKGLIQTYILDRPLVTVMGEPSEAFGEQMRNEEADRVKAQVEALTKENKEALPELETKLQDAIAANNKPAPSELIQSFSIPDISKVPVIPVYPLTNKPTMEQPDVKSLHPEHGRIEAQLRPVLSDYFAGQPFFFIANQVKSSFVTLRAILDTSILPEGLKRLTPLFEDVIFESPVTRPSSDASSDSKSEELTHEDFVKLLQGETVSYSAQQGGFAQSLTVSIKVEEDKLERAVQLLVDSLWNVRFTTERLLIVLNRLLSSIPSRKSDAFSVCRGAIQTLNFTSDSMQQATNLLRHQKYYTELKTKLEDSKTAAQVVEDFNRLRTLLLSPARLMLELAGNIVSYTDLAAPFRRYLPKFEAATPEVKAASIPWSRNFLKGLDQTPASAMVIPVAGTESSYMLCTIPHSFTHAEDKTLAILRVTCEYLTALEGPLWKRLRGMGLSYSYNMRSDVETGLLTFQLYKSTNPIGAWQEAQNILQEFASEQVKLDATWLESAKSGLAYSILSEQETPLAAAAQPLRDYLKGVPFGFNQRQLRAVKEVTLEQVAEGIKLLQTIFDPARAHVVCTTNPANVEAVSKGLKRDDVKVTKTVDDFFEQF